MFSNLSQTKSYGEKKAESDLPPNSDLAFLKKTHFRQDFKVFSTHSVHLNCIAITDIQIFYINSKTKFKCLHSKCISLFLVDFYVLLRKLILKKSLIKKICYCMIVASSMNIYGFEIFQDFYVGFHFNPYY